MLVWKPQSNHPHNLFARNLNICLLLVWKPQSSHPHNLFPRNHNIFSPLVWKPQSSHPHSYLQETLIFFHCVFHLVSIEGCQGFAPLCFILSPFLKLMFCLDTTLWAYVLCDCHLVNLCFITSSLHDFVFLLLISRIAIML
jgi:hypothetical protein